MKYFRQQLANNTLKKSAPFLFIFFVSIFLSLSFFYRFLQFSRASTFERLLGIFALLLFFNFGILEFLLPTIKKLSSNKYIVLISCLSFAFTVILFLLLPYKFTPFRTQHSMQISVPEASSAVVLRTITNSDDHEISLVDGVYPRTILPGNSVGFTDNLTGGVTLFIHADQAPTTVLVNWDGKSTRYAINENKPDLQIQTDENSFGTPDLLHYVFAIVNCVSDGISLVFLLIVLTQIVFDWQRREMAIIQKKEFRNVYVNRIVFLIQCGILLLSFFVLSLQKNSHYWFKFSLIIGLILWVFVIINRVFRKNALYVSLGLSPFLAMLFIWKFIPDRISSLGPLVIISILFIWLFFLLRYYCKRNGLLVFVFLLAAASIISNYTYFRNSAYFTRVDFLDAGRTFSGLVKGVCMDSATAISVSFYEQIDQANIVLSPRISKEFDLDTVRLAYINHLNSISVQSYLDSISLIQYKQLLINKDLIQTSDCQGDMIYLLGNPENGDRTYILYEYEDQNNDNLFVLPKNYLAKGLQ